MQKKCIILQFTTPDIISNPRARENFGTLEGSLALAALLAPFAAAVTLRGVNPCGAPSRHGAPHCVIKWCKNARNCDKMKKKCKKISLSLAYVKK